MPAVRVRFPLTGMIPQQAGRLCKITHLTSGPLVHVGIDVSCLPNNAGFLQGAPLSPVHMEERHFINTSIQKFNSKCYLVLYHALYVDLKNGVCPSVFQLMTTVFQLFI